MAVVAPWSADNSPAGNDRGGIAYVINARTGAVRPLISGVSLYYFTPSCGTGSTVALTRYTGTDERSTQLVLADAADAAVRIVRTLPGQYTDAVPAPGGGFFAASGNAIVDLAPGRRTVRARAPGQPFDLVANAAGEVDYLVGTGRSAASVWHLAPGGARRVGGGVFSQLALFEGRGGHTVAAGTAKLARGTGIVALHGQTSEVEAASLAGSAYSPVPVQSVGHRPQHGLRNHQNHRASTQPAAGGVLPRTPLLLSTRPGRVTSWMPTSTAPGTLVLPPVLRDDGHITGSRAPGAAGRAKPATRAGARSGAAQFTSTCAVPRNDVHLQAMQPSPEEVDWAANLAGRSLLTGSYARPQGYANLGLPSYSPSLDFPLPAPFGPGQESIPREVLEGLFAQESNFNQASWHSVQGVAGNPLIADYYGAAGGNVVGVATPDCGYGLGQVTTGMHTGDMSYDLQRKVAVDYAENAAAAAQILAQKWNELVSAGITANDSNPATLESWYLALWDYNSGLHPNTGTGPWGLGWANNPANPDYPYNRGPFLHADTAAGFEITYSDAATPGNWPYQEKVFGWMEVPIQSSLTGNASYAGTIETYDPSSNTNVYQDNPYELAQPGIDDFCDPADNQCDPTVCSRSLYGGNCDPLTVDGTGPCLRSDYECWWHLPDSWCSLLLNPCNSGSWEYNQGDAEPPAQSGDYYPIPTCAVAASDIPPGTDVVDSQAAAVNLQGCTSANENWLNSGSFAFTYGDPNVPTAQKTDMDLHQLGTGLGGHMWFTHTGEPTAANGVALWGITGTWTPSLPAYGQYDVKVYVPPAGASTTEADYTIDDGYGYHQGATINQNNYGDQWVSLGHFWLRPGATVSLTNLGVTSPGDLAFSGMAFVPVSGAPAPYAVLGDSYSAGEGTGHYDQGTDTSSDNCHRSPNSFGRQYANLAGYNGNVEDLSCSGAVISNLTATGQNGEPAQINALLPNAGLVTVTIGGNDAGFSSVITRCLTPGLSCQGYYNQDDANNEETLIDSLEPQLAATYTAIQNRAPNAAVVAVTYPNIFQPGTTCPGILNLPVSDVEYLIGLANYLDDTIVKAARQAGIAVLDERYAFAGHELCSGAPWVYSLPLPWPGGTAVLDQSAWFHPTPSGHAQMAADLQSFLGTGISAGRAGRPRQPHVPLWVPQNTPDGIPSGATARGLLGMLALTTSAPPVPYSTAQRATFGDWSQRDGCSTRDAVLRSDALTTAQGATQALTPKFGCPVTAGSWEWPYEAAHTIHSYTTMAALGGTAGMQIDHIVPIGDAYNSGAWNWPTAEKTFFYNDLASPQLLSVSQASNGSKGDQSPDQWMPQGYPTSSFPTAAPGHDFACEYDEMWVAVKYEYRLTITTPERAELNGLLGTCP